MASEKLYRNTLIWIEIMTSALQSQCPNIRLKNVLDSYWQTAMWLSRVSTAQTLHTAGVPAVRAALKTEMS